MAKGLQRGQGDVESGDVFYDGSAVLLAFVERGANGAVCGGNCGGEPFVQRAGEAAEGLVETLIRGPADFFDVGDHQLVHLFGQPFLQPAFACIVRQDAFQQAGRQRNQPGTPFVRDPVGLLDQLECAAAFRCVIRHVEQLGGGAAHRLDELLGT